MSLKSPGVSNEEKLGCVETASTVELLGTGICEDAKVSKTIVLGRLALTLYGPAIASLGGGMFSAHEATLGDDIGTGFPSEEALVCVKIRPWQTKECDLQGVGIGAGQGKNMSCNATR